MAGPALLTQSGRARRRATGTATAAGCRRKEGGRPKVCRGCSPFGQAVSSSVPYAGYARGTALRRGESHAFRFCRAFGRTRPAGVTGICTDFRRLAGHSRAGFPAHAGSRARPTAGRPAAVSRRPAPRPAAPPKRQSMPVFA